ncbi:MAG: hypothetical protein QNL91_13695 [Candidatus Krumholzibacteria bacterium]|nr:hypothetical protein [Candidatus Krumholzibacteria bacterium]
MLTLLPATAEAQNHSDSVRQYIERTEDLLVWAQGLVSETQSDPARRVLRQAAELHQRSMGLFERGMMIESLGVARRSRDAMWHSVRMAREAMGLEERIRIRTERFRDQHANLTERARESRNEQALEFLERARQQADRARDIYHQGDAKLAWKLLEQAGDLMHRSARLLADGGGPERLKSELERTRQLIDRTGERLGSEADPHQRQLMGEAEEALQRALVAQAEGQPGRALQMVGLAANLAHRAGEASAGTPDNEAVERQMERFAARAGRIADQVRDSGSSQARDMYERALHQRDRAVEAQQAGDSELALRQLRAAHGLLNQAEELTR